MNKLLIAGLGALIATATATATGAAPPPDIEAVSRAFDDAQYRKDARALDAMLAPDMVFIRGTGERTGRAAFIANFANPKLQFDPFVIARREIVALSGTIVVVTADGTMTGRDDGKRFSNHFRFSDIFRWRDGRWQVVFVQVSRIAVE